MKILSYTKGFIHIPIILLVLLALPVILGSIKVAQNITSRAKGNVSMGTFKVVNGKPVVRQATTSAATGDEVTNPCDVHDNCAPVAPPDPDAPEFINDEKFYDRVGGDVRGPSDLPYCQSFGCDQPPSSQKDRQRIIQEAEQEQQRRAQEAVQNAPCGVLGSNPYCPEQPQHHEQNSLPEDRQGALSNFIRGTLQRFVDWINPFN